METLNEIPSIQASVNSIAVFNQISPEIMAQHQHSDNQLSLAYQYVEDGKKPTNKSIYKVRSKSSRKLLLGFSRLTLKQGVLHQLYINNDEEYHQLVLPECYRGKVLKSLHDDMGHQGIERTLALLHERFYWPTMSQDASDYVTNCECCCVSKGDYTGPHTQQGSLVANNPMDLLCMDFTKVDPSKDGKENVLVLTDAFSKFSQAVVTPNQKALTVAKVLVDKWFHVYGIPSHIHSDKGCSFENEIIHHLCAMYGIKQTTTTPYNPCGNAQCERFNHTLFGLLKSLSKDEKANWPAHLPSMVFAYNATPHSTTGFQPYELMFG